MQQVVGELESGRFASTDSSTSGVPKIRMSAPLADWSMLI